MGESPQVLSYADRPHRARSGAIEMLACAAIFACGYWIAEFIVQLLILGYELASHVVRRYPMLQPRDQFLMAIYAQTIGAFVAATVFFAGEILLYPWRQPARRAGWLLSALLGAVLCALRFGIWWLGSSGRMSMPDWLIPVVGLLLSLSFGILRSLRRRMVPGSP